MTKASKVTRPSARLGGTLLLIATLLGGSGAWTQAQGTWTNGVDMPLSRSGFAAVMALDGKIYAIGGFDGDYLNDVYAYDSAIDSWTQKASMPTARSSPGAAVAWNR